MRLWRRPRPLHLPQASRTRAVSLGIQMAIACPFRSASFPPTAAPMTLTVAWLAPSELMTRPFAPTDAAVANLRREGIRFVSENDTEVAAGYLAWRLREGATLQQALEGCLDDLDGFYTFAVGTRDGFAVMRDPIACKPAVMAETDEWVAMASEYRAIAVLPGADGARSWEPEPARVYVWERERVA